MTPPKKVTEVDLRPLQAQVDGWIHSVGVRYFSVLTNLGILTEEVGELARILVRQYGDQAPKNSQEATPQALAEEFADVLFVLICLANQTGVDLTRAFQEKLSYKTERDKDRHQKNPKLA
ncbi:MAG: nucleotide pyrophosphohydrolase [Bacteroidia bacterium]